MEYAVKICKQLFLAINESPCEGKINYLDRYEIDIESPDGLVRIFSEDVLRPFSCTVPSTLHFDSLPISIGSKVLLEQSEIDLIGVNDSDTIISLKMAEPIDLSVDSSGMFLPTDLKQRMQYLLRAVELSDEKSELFSSVSGTSIDVFSLESKIRALSKEVQADDLNAIKSAATECSGYGAGRFPASDVMLGGYMLACSAYFCSMMRSKDRIKSVNQAILEGAVANTSRESGFLLWLASNGLADEDACQMFRSIFSDKSYPSVLASASAAIKLNGCDLLRGVYLFLLHFTY